MRYRFIALICEVNRAGTKPAETLDQQIREQKLFQAGKSEVSLFVNTVNQKVLMTEKFQMVEKKWGNELYINCLIRDGRVWLVEKVS